MGFFSKAWSSIKKGFKSIGRGIKKAVGSVGKFMNKIGIVGQIALMFILPGVGAALGGMLSSGVTALQGMGGFAAGVGNVLATVGKFAATAGNAFRTVTDGITSFVSNIGKGFLNQAATALGKETLLFKAGPATVSEGFGKWMQGVNENVSNITSPFAKAAEATTADVATAYERTFGDPIKALDLQSSPVSQGPSFESIFDDTLTIPDLNVISNEQPFGVELGKTAIDNIADAESGGLGGFLNDIKDHAINTAKEFPEKLIDQTAVGITGGIVASTKEALGISTPQPDFVTNVAAIPQFDTAPVMGVYEQNGINYGALPDNRVQFFASQNTGLQDFGIGSFSQFAKLRTA